MHRIGLIFSLILLFLAQACRTTTAPPHALEPAPAIDESPTLVPAPAQNLATEIVAESESGSESIPQQPVSSPPGLRVVYIREGNLWSWTEGGGAVQLTGTGDMSTARLSNDGKLLAFIRGREVWTVGMDGMNARMLSTLANEGGALWFSSDGSSLAVSTTDHIDVINLSDAKSVPVVAYLALPDRYFPEVIWSPDGLGFKTVIPPQTETGQAELLFVFTDGTVASLAKFTMVGLSKSFPYISPDGGYIIYVAQSGEGKDSLYLMDSSGATRPYGEPADSVRAYGWLPDSRHFLYGEQDSPKASLGAVGGTPSEIGIDFPVTIRWIDTERFLGYENGNLILGDRSGNKLPIDSAVQDFDFVP